ncbi:FAD/NAD(P)-binding domain-containing protein [Basidiobolus meristosporus CBS 931.73]|uniref:FAD/NAD(P)-binding domain-containing protein n=1 Tax=Basidiobolus meristosporus CBS 931.73 TaxID=1314790 RepID=A0A1Y1XVI4_9FUNG|nr:FAD/NAD(P)-binding domain-containing protein [Basidiobolus meristosporus CBS 931.73]|eukprot:ORX89733.1 FAD/NAD(P)-binding domain-containing protein [Basidiobolus meristosporus CBS 931.73]
MPPNAINTISPSLEGGRKRIAVVGSGLAGLTTAHLLSLNEEYEVHIFEKSSEFGADAASITLPIKDENGWTETRVDVPARAFSRDYYPSLTAMYEHLGISFQPADYSLSFSEFDQKLEKPSQPIFSYRNVKYKGYSIPFPDVFEKYCENMPERTQILAEWMRFSMFANEAARTNSLLSFPGSIGSFLKLHNYSEKFQHAIFIPFLSSICTCSYTTVANMPASDVLDFFATSILSEPVLKVRAGIRDVCKKLSENVHSIRFNCTVKSIYRDEERSEANPESPSLVVQTGSGEKFEFHHVIMATQGINAYKIFLPASPPSAQLSATVDFKYEYTLVVTHKDPKLMPENRDDWRGINLFKATNYPQQHKSQKHVPEQTIGFSDQVMSTIWINRAEDKDFEENIFQTVNPLVEPDPATVINRTWFHRSVLSPASHHAIDQLHQIQGRDNIWFVGAYVYPGIPLLEGCVQSSMEVCEALGVTAPWGIRSHKFCDSGKRTHGLRDGFSRAGYVDHYFNRPKERCSTWSISSLVMCFVNAIFAAFMWSLENPVIRSERMANAVISVWYLLVAFVTRIIRFFVMASQSVRDSKKQI